jgi:predicted AAA+ superfamily ATPase
MSLLVGPRQTEKLFQCLCLEIIWLRKEITKSPVTYFYDLGLRNYALGLYGSLIHSPEVGFDFQNFILNLLKERFLFSPAGIHFWRTKDKAEVDFIIDFGQTILPVEVKFKELKKTEIGRSLRSFINRYQPEMAWVINLELRERIKLDKTKIHFLPFWDIIVDETEPYLQFPPWHKDG